METELKTISVVDLEDSVLQIQKSDCKIIAHKNSSTFSNGLLGYSILLLFILLTSAGVATSIFLFYASVVDANDKLALFGLSLFFLFFSFGPLFGIVTCCNSLFSYTHWIDFKNRSFKARKFGIDLCGSYEESDIKLVVKPLYSRGGWGAFFSLETGKSSYEFFSLGIIGTEANAKTAAGNIIKSVIEYFPCFEVDFDKSSWKKNKEKSIWV